MFFFVALTPSSLVLALSASLLSGWVEGSTPDVSYPTRGGLYLCRHWHGVG